MERIGDGQYAANFDVKADWGAWGRPQPVPAAQVGGQALPREQGGPMDFGGEPVRGYDLGDVFALPPQMLKPGVTCSHEQDHIPPLSREEVNERNVLGSGWVCANPQNAPGLPLDSAGNQPLYGCYPSGSVAPRVKSGASDGGFYRDLKWCVRLCDPQTGPRDGGNPEAGLGPDYIDEKDRLCVVQGQDADGRSLRTAIDNLNSYTSWFNAPHGAQAQHHSVAYFGATDSTGDHLLEFEDGHFAG